MAWELLPLNFRVLQINVALNGLTDSVDLVPRGASDRARTAAARMNEASPGMTSLGRGEFPWKMEDVGGEQLPVAPAGDELTRLGVARVDVIKIDVEGHEIEALKGLGPLRRLGVQRLHTEFFPAMIEANGHASVDYLHFLHEQGLDCYSHFDTELRPSALLRPEKFAAFAEHQKASGVDKHTDLYCMMRGSSTTNSTTTIKNEALRRRR